MLNVDKMTASARECLGWPYVSPGSNNKDGIDCSGLFDKMYRDQSSSIYHGSNTIFRNHCSETGKLTSTNQLQAGMAVFKRKDWTDADQSNKWYGKEPGNISHIGYVANVHPLEIIHASTGTMCVTIDTKIGKWAYWGKLKDVDYGSMPSQSSDSEPSLVEDQTKTKYVYAFNGKPVNMRKKPDIHAALIERVPVGTSVTWLKDDGAGWAYIRYHGLTGWMLDCFLAEDDSFLHPAEPVIPETPVESEPTEGDNMTVQSENGKPVKLRQKPSTYCNVYDEVPVGSIVRLVQFGEDWCKVDFGIRKGWYMMTKFLKEGCG